MEYLSEAIQEQFIELTNDSFAKDEFHTCNLKEIWVKMQRRYPRLGIHALNILNLSLIFRISDVQGVGGMTQ